MGSLRSRGGVKELKRCKNRLELTNDRHDLANDMNTPFNVTSEERLHPLDIFRRLAGFSKQSQGRLKDNDSQVRGALTYLTYLDRHISKVKELFVFSFLFCSGDVRFLSNVIKMDSHVSTIVRYHHHHYYHHCHHH